MARLYGFMTGVNSGEFARRIEEPTSEAIDWTSVTGGEKGPWPPDVWIEGNNHQGAMRVTYKGDMTELPYSKYTEGGGFDMEGLISDVGDILQLARNADPNWNQTQARMPGKV